MKTGFLDATRQARLAFILKMKELGWERHQYFSEKYSITNNHKRGLGHGSAKAFGMRIKTDGLFVPDEED